MNVIFVFRLAGESCVTLPTSSAANDGQASSVGIDSYSVCAAKNRGICLYLCDLQGSVFSSKLHLSPSRGLNVIFVVEIFFRRFCCRLSTVIHILATKALRPRNVLNVVEI